MSEIRETTLHLLQDATDKTLDLRLEQEVKPKPLTVIELKPDTKETFLRCLTEGSVVDWGDGTKSVVTAEEAQAKEVKHTYADTSTTNRVVTIDGVIDRTKWQSASAFDSSALTFVRSLGELRGEAKDLFSNCSWLEKINNGIFDHCPEVTSFNSCFQECWRLGEIPIGLFDHCTAVTDFSYCFFECRMLRSVPTGLFDHCKKATNFEACFHNCQNASWSNTPYTMVNGMKVRLWERSSENGFAKVESYYRCFRRCGGFTDYAEIPPDWK